MASYYDTQCPHCGKKFTFCKWDDWYRKTGQLQCDNCGCVFVDDSKYILKDGKA